MSTIDAEHVAWVHCDYDACPESWVVNMHDPDAVLRIEAERAQHQANHEAEEARLWRFSAPVPANLLPAQSVPMSEIERGRSEWQRLKWWAIGSAALGVAVVVIAAIGLRVWLWS